MASAPVGKARPYTPKFETGIARDGTGIARARRFRDSVMQREAGQLPTDDRFDAFGEHLVVRESQSGEIVGSCRILAPRDAQRAGGYEAECHFDTALLIVLRDRLVELDGPCVHPHYRFENVVTYLWSALARYLIENRHDYVLAMAGISLRDGGHVAASTHRLACARFLSPDDYRVFPYQRLPLENLSDTRQVILPALLKGYVELGAWVCGEPAVMPRLAQAHFPVLLPLARMRSSQARQFLAQAI